MILNIEGVHTFQLAMNEFGDLRGHEFVSKLNGFRARSEKKVRKTGPNCDQLNNPPAVYSVTVLGSGCRPTLFLCLTVWTGDRRGQ